jgi:hypothetical protein
MCLLWLLSFADFSWHGFIFNFAAAADWDVGGFAVSDTSFFAVEVAGWKWW